MQGLAQLGRNAIERVAQLEAELAGYVEANRYMKGELDDALEDARKYCAAKLEIARLIDANRHQHEIIGEQSAQMARLREALAIIAHPVNIGKLYHMDAVAQARAALAQVAEVPNG